MIKIITPGIYKIENIVTGDIYIGQSVNPTLRQSQHWRRLTINKHHNIYLQRAWNKYGKDCFVFEIILFCEHDQLSIREQELVDRLDPAYNIRKDCVDSPLGTKHSEETRRKLSESHKGQKAHNLGKKTSYEVRMKQSRARMGKRPANYGVPCSEEAKKKISEKLKGNVIPPEVRQKLSESMKRYWKNKLGKT